MEDRATKSSPGRWQGLRDQVNRDRHTLPASHSGGWTARWLSLGPSAEETAAGAGTAACELTEVTMDMQARVARLDWKAIETSLWQRGYAKVDPFLMPTECDTLIALYQEEDHFRSRIDMRRYRFGEGEYKYFTYPLPPLVQEVRQHFYPRLAPIANAWADALGETPRYPISHVQFLAVCEQHGQPKPTPLLLRYTAGGYNCLHQDLYGDVAFPLQLTMFLSRRGQDFTGGEFLLVEQRPRAQSRGEAIVTEQGEIVIFATRSRPARGSRGLYRVHMRHGVSTVHSGSRFALGVIFHDAQ